MRKSFWTHKKVLITGAGGFVGSHLFRFLSQAGADVIGTTRRKSRDARIITCDVTNLPALTKIYGRTPLFACYHLAADALVEQGQKEPYKTLRNNIVSALNILELARLHRTKRVIIASTVHVYGDSQNFFSEEDPPKPSRPYETSKTCVDVIAQSYADTFHLPVLIPRFVNIYGPGDLNFTRVIPKTLQNILHRENPLLWGGVSTREYLYIKDALIAFDLLARMSDQQIERNRIYNFSTGEPISARHLLEEIIRLSKMKLTVKMIHEGRADEIPQQRVSWVKAKRVFGWAPTVHLEQGLMMTIDWYKRYFTMEKSQKIAL